MTDAYKICYCCGAMSGGYRTTSKEKKISAGAKSIPFIGRKFDSNSRTLRARNFHSENFFGSNFVGLTELASPRTRPVNVIGG